MEYDPKYADVIILRWQELTGGIAINTVTGEPFAPVQMEASNV